MLKKFFIVTVVAVCIAGYFSPAIAGEVKVSGAVELQYRNSSDIHKSTGDDVLKPEELYLKVQKEVSPGIEALIKVSDIIILHTSGNDEVIGNKEMDMIKKGSFLINMARGECINEEAVFNSLQSGRLAGFASDVNPNFNHRNISGVRQNILLTSHQASLTYTARKWMEEIAVDNLIKGLREL